MSNLEFATREQVLFICYDDIIKLNYPLMLQTVVKDYYDDLNHVFKLDKIKNYDLKNLDRLCVERIEKNPLRYLARSEEYYDLADELLLTFESEFIEMYANSELTVFGAKLYNVLMQTFVKKVYIYTEKPIYQIIVDCKKLFSDFESKITYLSGEFADIVKDLDTRPTTYILNDIDYAKQLIDNDMVEYTELLIAELGYNFKLNEMLDVVMKHDIQTTMEDRLFKVGILPVIDLSKEHFSCLEEIANDASNNL